MSPLRRRAVILADSDFMVQRAVTSVFAPLRICFDELGYDVRICPDEHTLDESIATYSPHVVAVDVRNNEELIERVETVLNNQRRASTTIVLFYNCQSVQICPAARTLPRAYYAGRSLSDRDLINLVLPVRLGMHHDGGRGMDGHAEVTSALEGPIETGKVTELFQYLEMAKKTGCLTLEQNGPFGAVFFRNGRIVHAHTRKSRDKDAAMSAVGLSDGYFRFIQDRRPVQENCLLSPMQIALLWAKNIDEKVVSRPIESRPALH